MEDGFAREGVLARCNQNRDASDEDVECVNARRAASVLAADEEQAKRSDRAAQSERKLVAMRDRGARAEQAHQQAEAAAEAASDAAYEARWRDAKPPAQQAGDGKSSAPSFGAPIGDKMPSMNERSHVDEIYGDSLSRVPERPEIELAAATPPKGDVAPPQLEIEKGAVIPRPFRQSDASASSR